MTVEVGGRRFEVRLWAPETARLRLHGAATRPPAPPPRLAQVPAREPEGCHRPDAGHHRQGAPPGRRPVAAGDPLFVLEAMKMENEIRSPVAGQIVDLRVQPGDLVAGGQVLAIVR